MFHITENRCDPLGMKLTGRKFTLRCLHEASEPHRQTLWDDFEVIMLLGYSITPCQNHRAERQPTWRLRLQLHLGAAASACRQHRSQRHCLDVSCISSAKLAL